MTTRHWCFTLNNYTENEDNLIRALSETNEVSYLVFGYEVGAQGTPHLQGYVCFSGRKSLRQAKLFLHCERVHLEAKRGTPKQASDYCKKEGLFFEAGVIPTTGTASQFDAFTQWVQDYVGVHSCPPSERVVAREWPALFVRYSAKLMRLVLHLSPAPRIQDGACNAWQEELGNVLQLEPDDRTVVFVLDEEGGKGKSWFQRMYVSQYPDKVQLLSVGRRDDIAHAIDASKSVFLFNVPRGGMEFLQYPILEQLKDRVVFSPKYDSMTKVISSTPHVVVFCNESPDMTKMTADRYFVWNINE